MRSILLALAACAGVLAEVRQLPLKSEIGGTEYDGHQVWRLDWANLSRDVQEEIVDAVELMDLDIWRKSPKNLDIRLDPTLLPLLQKFIPPLTTFEPFIQDLTPLLSVQAGEKQDWDIGTIQSKFHDEYHSLEDIYLFGDMIKDGFNGLDGLFVEAFEFGQTEQGRSIKGWRAWMEEEEVGASGKRKKGKKGRKPLPVPTPPGDDGGSGNEYELEFIVQSGQHAREWVGPSTAMYWFHDLLTLAIADKSSHQAQLLRSFTFTVIPTINPDGYVYSHDHARLWRKNRQNIDSPICQGIDLNSNWGYKWRKSRASPCSDAYSGDHALQAKEVSAMADWLSNTTSSRPGKTRKVRAFIDLHSYGQLFMFPFAYSCDDFPPDAEMLMEAGLGVAKAMRMGHGEGYQAGQACDLTYRAPGDAIDHAYGLVDARWSYSAELRDTGTYGFMLPPSLIRPTAEEVTAGLLYLAKFIYVSEIAP